MFAVVDILHKTIRAFQAPFVIKMGDNKETVLFRVIFDVVHVWLPFFIGLLTLKTMVAALNLRCRSTTLIAHQPVYRLDLANVDSLLRLPLLCKNRYTGSLRIGNKNVEVTQARAVPNQNTPKTYCYSPSHYLKGIETIHSEQSGDQNPCRVPATKRITKLLRKVYIAIKPREPAPLTAAQVKKFHLQLWICAMRVPLRWNHSLKIQNSWCRYTRS